MWPRGRDACAVDTCAVVACAVDVCAVVGCAVDACDVVMCAVNACAVPVMQCDQGEGRPRGERVAFDCYKPRLT